MAQPASRPLPDPPPHGEADRRARRWAHVQAAMITAADTIAKVSVSLGGRPGDGAVVVALEGCLSVLAELGEVARNCRYDEELREAEIQRRVDEALAAYGITRGRLAAVPDPD